MPRFHRDLPHRRPQLHVVAALLSLAVLVTACSGDDTPVLGGGCQESADCGFLDNGDPCDGTYTCVAGTCQFDPQTVVTCDASKDTACSVQRCDPADGACKPSAQPDGTLCDDGQPCSLGDACKAGACVAGATELCDCLTTADCKDDGNKCNGTPLCDTSSFPHRCVVNPATVVTCAPDKAPCKQAACDPKTGTCGSTPVPDGGACDDGDACTTGDTCQGGTCAGGTDTCACNEDSDCEDPDGDKCTGVPYCDKSGGAGGAGVCKNNPATVVSCSTKLDTACAKNLCQPGTGACALTSVKDETPCDDGDACTKGDVCVGGQCASGTDTCKCASDKECEGTDDGDKCNGLPFCNKATGKCETNPATVVSCPTVGDTECAKNVCVPKTGACVVLPRAEVKLLGCLDVDLGGIVGKQCVYGPAATPGKGPFACDDGNACSQGEICQGKTCGGGKVTCECTEDTDCANKDDGDLCNGTMFCDKAVGTCKLNPASVVYCSKKDDTACEKAACQPKSGVCSLAPVKGGAACDDGDACTTSDACDGKGACAGAGALKCDDGKACTTDTCDPKAGCVHKAKTCDDGNGCTVDSCDAKTGQCAHKARPEGFVCNADGNGCTVGDACKAGSCVAGKPMICTGTAAPCQELKCLSGGAFKGSCVAVAGQDGAPCPDAKGACQVGATCKAGKCLVGKKRRLFDTLLGKSGESSAAHDVAVLPDGRLLVGGGVSVAKGKWAPRLSLHERTGELIWQLDGKPASPDATTRSWGVAAPGDGALWSLERDTKGTRTTAWLRRYATDKQLVGTVEPETKLRVVSAVALEEVHSGGVVSLINVDANPGSGVTYCWRATRYSPLMKELWTNLSCNNGDVGTELFVDKEQALVVRKYKWGSQWLGGWVGLGLNTASGTSVALPGSKDAFTAGPASGGDALVYISDGQSTYVWRVNDTAADTDHGRKMAPGLMVGRVAAFGDKQQSAGVGTLNGAPVVLRLDSEGNTAWVRTMANSGSLAAVAGADDDIVAVGHRSVAGVTRAWLLRAGPYGQTTCGTLGKCAGKGRDACDDGKGCTADSCEAKLGCQHDAQVGFTCQLDDGCSRYASCATGSCKPAEQGRRFATRTNWQDTVDEGSLDTAERADGRSETWSIEANKARHNVFSVWGRTDSTGFLPICSGFTALDAIDRRADGSLFLLGHSGSGSGARARYCRRGADGALSGGGKAVLLSAGCNGGCKATPTGSDMATDGTTWVAGSSAYGSSTRAFIERVPASGTGWSAGYYYGAPTVGLAAVAMADGGGGLLLGTGPESSGTTRLIVKEHNAKTRFSVTFPGGTWARAADTLKDGSLIVVGRSLISGTVRLFARKVAATNGKTLWQRSQTVADYADARAVVGLKDGGAAITGQSSLYGAKRPFLERLDSAGGSVWRRTYTTWGKGGIGLSVAPWSGGFLVGTRVYASGNPKQDQPGQVKTDANGYAGCAIAGTCLGKTCDDKNACTTDWCDAKGGCQHTAVAGCK